MLRFFFMFSLSLCAVITDLRTNRIPNVLTGAGAAAGLLLGIQESLCSSSLDDSGISFFRAFFSGAAGGVLSWAAAVSIPLLFGILLHRHNLMGAGDTKLLAALCGIAGPGMVLPVLALSLVSGGVCSLIIMFISSGFRRRLSVLAANVHELHVHFHYCAPAVSGSDPGSFGQDGPKAIPFRAGISELSDRKEEFSLSIRPDSIGILKKNILRLCSFRYDPDPVDSKVPAIPDDALSRVFAPFRHAPDPEEPEVPATSDTVSPRVFAHIFSPETLRREAAFLKSGRMHFSIPILSGVILSAPLLL